MITKDTLIIDALKMGDTQQLAEILMESGMGCLHCALAHGETIEEEGIELVEEGWHHLVMVSFALPEGEVSVEMKSTSGKTVLMPQLKTMTFFSSAVLSVAEEADE